MWCVFFGMLLFCFVLFGNINMILLCCLVGLFVKNCFNLVIVLLKKVLKVLVSFLVNIIGCFVLSVVFKLLRFVIIWWVFLYMMLVIFELIVLIKKVCFVLFFVGVKLINWKWFVGKLE